MEKLLFFGLTDAEFQKIKPVASAETCTASRFPFPMYHNTLSAIASGRAVPASIPRRSRHTCPRQPHGCFRRRCPCRCLRRFRCLRHAQNRQHSGSRLPPPVCSSCASCPSAGWTSCCLNCAASTPPSTTRLYSRPQTPDGRFVFS